MCKRLCEHIPVASCCLLTCWGVCVEHLEYFTLELVLLYWGADKSLARPWKERSYSDQDLQHYTKTYGVQTTGIYSCYLYAVSVGIVLWVLVAVASFLPGSG